jgi:hypothetical protein
MAANPPEPGSAAPAASSNPASPAPTSSTPTPSAAAVPAKAAAPTTPAAPRPATPAARPAEPKSGGGANGSLVLLSLIAVLIALGASAVAVYSLDQARQATSRANEAYDTAKRAAATPTKAPAVTGSTTAKPTPTASKGPAFVAELVRTPLKVPAAASPCASVYVDIDKMTVGDSNGHEFYASNCVGPLSLHVDRTGGAVPTTANPTPDLCASQITNETANTELIMPVINGLSFCLLTNKADAAQQSLPQRLAIVEVTDVGADNSIQLVVSTWRVPTP